MSPLARMPLGFIGVLAALAAMALVPSMWAVLPLVVSALCIAGLGFNWLWALGRIGYRENHIPAESPPAHDPAVDVTIKPMRAPDGQVEFWIAYSITAFGMGDTRDAAVEDWKENLDRKRQMWRVD